MFEFAECFQFLGLEAADACCLFKDGPAIAVARLQKRIDPPLLDDAISRRASPAAKKQIFDILEAGDLAVEQIFAGAVAVDAAGDGDLVGFGIEQVPCVIECERDLGHADALARRRAVKDHVGHLAAAQVFRALLAENPPDGIDDVALPGPIRADDGRQPGREIEPRPVGETFEADHFQPLQHSSAPSGRGPGT